MMKIDANGIRIHVEERGAGSPSLVFLHYWGGSSRTWRHVVDALSGTHKTFALDHRGWGQSDAPASGYAIADLAADAAAAIEALGLGEYVLVGHSMGAKVAQWMAASRPARLRGLVLVAPAPPTPSKLPREARQMMVDAYGSAESVGTVIEQVLTHQSLDPADRAQVIEDSLRGARRAKQAWPMAMMFEDIRDRTAAIDVPALVIAGENDQVDPVDTLKVELLPHLPRAGWCVLPGTGHLSPLESPQALADLIVKFASGLPYPAGSSNGQPMAAR